ncbi:melanocortin receptor 4-like [Exaiptasia diaphana]|uniref:G-protein coupled receptors family 1 profile domain-containing protein n=1 Tax=Exaiptasia diaphana TaxID=2652724 RepID=A0A913YI84_EXADI|nr:melanocortin receptor 4-like [Exaiptasia diaphana]
MSFGNCSHLMQWYTHREQLKVSSLCFVITTGLLSMPIAVSNALILLTIWRKPAFQSPSNIFICNLALSDIAVAVIGIPLWISSKVYDLMSGDPDTACTLAYSATVAGTTVSGASCLTLISAILDRYLALRLHLRYPSVVTKRRVAMVCGCTWFTSLSVAIAVFIGITVYDFAVISVMIPYTILLFFSYYKIFRVVHRHQNQIHAQNNDTQKGPSLNISRYKKTVSALAYLLIVFFILYSPIVGFSFYHQVRGPTLLYMHGWTISILLLFFNSAVNPLICCWKLGDLRRAMKKTLFKFIRKDDVSVTWATETAGNTFQ